MNLKKSDFLGEAHMGLNQNGNNKKIDLRNLGETDSKPEWGKRRK